MKLSQHITWVKMLFFFSFFLYGYFPALRAAPYELRIIDSTVFNANETMSNTLRRLIGKEINIGVATSNGDLTGRVIAVSGKLVHLQRTIFRKQFDILLKIDEITFISARVR